MVQTSAWCKQAHYLFCEVNPSEHGAWCKHQHGANKRTFFAAR